MSTGISVSIDARDYEKEQTPMQKAVTCWLAKHPYWLTHSFPSGTAAKGVWGQAYRDIKAYLRAELTDEDGVWEYPTETAAFKKKFIRATLKA